MALDLPDRIYGQYRNKPKALAWYQITRTQGDKICDVYDQLRETYNIDTQVGAQLDVIGRIVGISREYIFSELADYNGFGQQYSQFGAGQFMLPEYAETRSVNDGLYRLLIKSKIAKNVGTATYDDIIKAMEIIIPNKGVTVVNGFDMTFSLDFTTPLSATEKEALDNFDVVPTPQGVEFTGYTE